MSVTYRDISKLTKKQSVSGQERIPVSANEFITVDQIYGQQICIHTKKDNTAIEDVKPEYAFYTVIEGVTADNLAEMADPEKYRLVLMRWRKQAREGARWRIPMLPYELDRRKGREVWPRGIAEADTWWPVTGRIVPWFRNGRTLDQAIGFNINKSAQDAFFCATRNLKMRVGVALFKKTGAAGEGWSRISNISHIELFLCARKTTKPYVRVTIRP